MKQIILFQIQKTTNTKNYTHKQLIKTDTFLKDYKLSKLNQNKINYIVPQPLHN